MLKILTLITVLLVLSGCENEEQKVRILELEGSLQESQQALTAAQVEIQELNSLLEERIAAESRAEEARIAAAEEAQAEEARIAAAEEAQAEEARIAAAEEALAGAEVCNEENEALKEVLAKSICLELVNTRRFETSLRFQIAQKHGFGIGGADTLADADRLQNCGALPSLVIGMACAADAVDKLKREWATEEEATGN